MNFKTSIENSPQLQLDFLICEFLHKTPAEVRELEKEVKHYRRIVIFLVSFDVSSLVSLAIAIVARLLLG